MGNGLWAWLALIVGVFVGAAGFTSMVIACAVLYRARRLLYRAGRVLADIRTQVAFVPDRETSSSTSDGGDDG